MNYTVNLEERIGSFQIYLYSEHTYEEVKEEFIRVRDLLNLNNNRVIDRIMEGSVVLFENPPERKLKHINASDINRIIDELDLK